MESIELQSPNTEFKIRGINEAQSEFIEKHLFVINKFQNGKLFCELCFRQFIAHTSFFIVANDQKREIVCHPCNNRRNGIDPHEQSRQELKNRATTPAIEKQEPYQTALF